MKRFTFHRCHSHRCHLHQPIAWLPFACLPSPSLPYTCQSWRRLSLLWCVLLCLAIQPLGCSRLRRLPTSEAERLATENTESKNRLGIPWRTPKQDRRWRPDLAIMPSVDFLGGEVVLHHVRNCRYRTEEDYDVRHYDLRFRLDDVRTVDFLVVPFKDVPLLAHTMLSFGLADGRHFIVSVEARLEQGETYTPSGGSLGRYELMYVVGDERDLIPLRTEVRGVDVYLYRGNAAPAQVQDLLVDMLRRVNQLQQKPEYYDTLTNNCTTNIVDHINRLKPGTIRLDPRVLLPGHSDHLAYDLGLIQTSGTFEETKAKSRINRLVPLYEQDPQFSLRIRGS